MEDKIDLVYLWVDDTDSAWKEKLYEYRKKTDKYNPDAVDICRFYNNDELKYSLRSVEKNAPWINKIFIITDNQIPDWLNIKNPKIRIVDHSEIIPNDKLPLFNSCAIESRIPFIKELSECFLYANDDMFIWQPVEKNFFFSNGVPICRKGKNFKLNRVYKGLYGSTILRAYGLVKNKFEIKEMPFFPHHNIDAYRKSLFLECIEIFQEDFDNMLNHKFRAFDDVQRMIVTFYALSQQQMITKNTYRNFVQNYIFTSCSDSRLFNIKKNSLKKIKNCKSKLVCLNDTRKTSFNDRQAIRDLLEQIFNKKSDFEV